MEKLSHFQKAFDLYKGYFFPEGQGTWVLSLRQKLALAYEEAGLYLSHISLEAKDLHNTLSLCNLLIQENHCLEEAHRLAMRAYAGLGDRPSLIRQFDKCKQALQETLGTEPSPQTIRLFKILSR